MKDSLLLGMGTMTVLIVEVLRDSIPFLGLQILLKLEILSPLPVLSVNKAILSSHTYRW